MSQNRLPYIIIVFIFASIKKFEKLISKRIFYKIYFNIYSIKKKNDDIVFIEAFYTNFLFSIIVEHVEVYFVINVDLGSSKYCSISKFGIDRDVRVYNLCYEQN